MAGSESRLAFANELNAERLARHLSIRALARLAEVRPATIQGWLKGTHSPAPSLRAKYLRMVGLLNLAHAMPDDLWLDNLGPTSAFAAAAPGQGAGVDSVAAGVVSVGGVTSGSLDAPGSGV